MRSKKRLCFRERGADGRRVGVDPGVRKGAALVGLDGVDAAEVVVGEERA